MIMSNNRSCRFLLIVTILLSLDCGLLQPDISLIGKAVVVKHRGTCTLVHCLCCNQCSYPLELTVGTDTIMLWTYIGQREMHFGIYTKEPLPIEQYRRFQEIVCYARECDSVDCSPIKLGETYEVKGRWMSVHKEYDVFLLKSFKCH
jgi:hypothetical protein